MKIFELFDTTAHSTKWNSFNVGKELYYENQFTFNGQEVKIFVKHTSDLDEFVTKELKNKEILFKKPAIVYLIAFSVNGDMSRLGAFGTSSTKLFGQIVNSLTTLLSTMYWDVLTFGGNRGSRNKLYLALSRMISIKYGAKYIQNYDDFYIYRNETT